jgi:hypothetical protein
MKTDREYKAAERQRKRAAGLAPLEVWAAPEHHAAIRAFARSLGPGGAPPGPPPEGGGPPAGVAVSTRWRLAPGGG